MKTKLAIFKSMIAILLLSITQSLYAQDHDELVTLAEVTAGTLLMQSDHAGKYRLAPTLDTSVDMKITGVIARASVTQVFHNPGNEWQEAIYAFPLPEDAAVDHMKMIVGDRIIEGQIKEKQQAKKIYQQAKADGKRTALVEQHRPNLFTTAVANIPPGGTIKVNIEYQQPVVWRDDVFTIRFPMAITPRYKPVITSVMHESIPLDGGWAILPGEIPNAVPLPDQDDAEAGMKNSISMQVQLETGFQLDVLESLYHKVIKETDEEGRVNIRFTEEVVAMDRDFVLQWRPEAGQTPRAAFFTEQTEKGTYGLLMVMPPDPGLSSIRTKRETIFVIDTSGSMGGASIRQAKKALAAAIDRLQPEDRFNVVQFNSSTHRLFDQPRKASSNHKLHAQQYVRLLNAGGGTEMLPALEEAFRLSSGEGGLLPQIIFITDGAVGNESQLLGFIQKGLHKRRLYTVGIGSAPNSHFMTEAAHFGRGTFTYIGKPSEVEEKMKTLFYRLERPVLTDLRLTLPMNVDALPDPIPDLYAGEPLVVIMKLGDASHEAKPTTSWVDNEGVQLSGRFDNTGWKSNLSLKAGKGQSGLGVYWGREKIRQWLRQGIRGVDETQIRKAVLDLAFEHHLVSRYTSLVAVDVTPVRPVDANIDSHAIKGNLPAGLKSAGGAVSQNANMQLAMAKGSTASMRFLILGLILLVLAYLANAMRDPQSRLNAFLNQ